MSDHHSKRSNEICYKFHIFRSYCFKAKPNDLNIIQVYAPTADTGNEGVEKLYNEVRELLNKHDVNIIMGTSMVK